MGVVNISISSPKSGPVITVVGSGNSSGVVIDQPQAPVNIAIQQGGARGVAGEGADPEFIQSVTDKLTELETNRLRPVELGRNIVAFAQNDVEADGKIIDISVYDPANNDTTKVDFTTNEAQTTAYFTMNWAITNAEITLMVK